MQTDIEIAQAADVKPITEIATIAGLKAHEIEHMVMTKQKSKLDPTVKRR